jgi:hypothetical protein
MTLFKARIQFTLSYIDNSLKAYPGYPAARPRPPPLMGVNHAGLDLNLMFMWEKRFYSRKYHPKKYLYYSFTSLDITKVNHGFNWGDVKRRCPL